MRGTRAETVKLKHGGYCPLKEKRKRGKFYLGIDLGSTSSDVVVLDESSKVVLCDYRRTKGRPIETVYAQLLSVFEQLETADIAGSAVTGTAGRFLAKLLENDFINEVPAQAAAIGWLYPNIDNASIIEMGGQDSKLIFVNREHERLNVRDFSLNSVCAAGTGSFLDQQAQRLGVNIEEEFGRLALESKNIPQMAGRCSVFAKSDMIHLQQQATPTCDIVAGLCMALARNLKSNLGCGREFVKPIIFTGGVAANIGVVRAIEKAFELDEDELVVSKMNFYTGALGAILLGKTKDRISEGFDIERLERYLTNRNSQLKGAMRRKPLEKPVLPVPQSRVYSELLSESGEAVNAYLGIDVGSISTNVVVMDDRRRILAKAYLMTAGRPLEAVKEGLAMVAKDVAGKVKIVGAATTGSGRYLTGDFIGADTVINEITAQAAGAMIVNPKVDTIFEIGGQDSKYISLENGVVVDFEMNHACAAGTGSFLEEQAQRLGINIKDEFANLAFKSGSPISLGERCTVFIESDLLNYQQQGAKTEDLVSGLSYSIAANYLNRVVGRRKIGDNICFQGGTAFNKAVWSAFEMVTGKPIMVPDHHEVTGALGAAAIAAEYMNKISPQQTASKFKGFENLIAVSYDIESFGCEHCPNNCEIKKVQLAGSEPLYYGCRCDRYNVKKKSRVNKGFDAFEYRRQKLLEYAGVGKDKSPANGVKIGIPRALIFWQFLPFFARFFESLGFEVVLSGDTNGATVRKGVEMVTASPCFPVKVAYGHIAELIEKGADYVFLPSIVSMPANFDTNKHNQACPYVQSLPYQVGGVFEGEGVKSKILTAPIYMGDGAKRLRKSMNELAAKLGVSLRRVPEAIECALSAQKNFEKSLRQKGAEILSQTADDEKLFVLVSRPYNGCDEGVNLQLTKKLAEHGVKAIPMDMLTFEDAPLSDLSLHKQVYWSYGQKILRAAEIIKRDKRLYAIYLSNFSCGPDSFLLTFFKDIMAKKPCLQLELDEHSADAGLVTRLEAFFESLKHYNNPKPQHAEQLIKPVKIVTSQRTLYIPYMSDCSYGFAAAFRAYGQPSEVMPIADESSLLKGRKFTTGKECLPCAITSGDMLEIVTRQGFEPDKAAFFMPSGCGPCRFGMYNSMHRLILRYADAADVPVIAPNQDCGFYEELKKNIKYSSRLAFVKSIWTATVGIDLMYKALLRIRPFAHDRRQAQDVYEKSLREWIAAVEGRKSFSNMTALMEKIAADFGKVKLDSTLQKPTIGIVGEIYVRNHPFANCNIIAHLEQLGAVCEPASLAEWIYYTNFTRKRKASSQFKVKEVLLNKFKDSAQHNIEKKLAASLEKRFGKLSDGNIEHVLGLAKNYIDDTFEGEAVLSIGKAIEFHHDGAGGVVNVMPFGCMPSTIVSSQTMRVSKDCGNMPILNLSFDGQEDSTLITRLEAFVEQVRQRNNSVRGCRQMI